MGRGLPRVDEGAVSAVSPDVGVVLTLENAGWTAISACIS